MIVVVLCLVGLSPIARHVRCFACCKRKRVTKIQMDIEPYFTTLNSLARFTIESGAGDEIVFEDHKTLPATSKLPFEMEQYFSTLNQLARLTVETGAGDYIDTSDLQHRATSAMSAPAPEYESIGVRSVSPKDDQELLSFHSSSSSPIDSNIKCSEYVY